MQALVITLYALSMVVSAAGVLVPFLRVRHRVQKTGRAEVYARSLLRRKYRDEDAAETDDERQAAHAAYREAMDAPFENGRETVQKLSEGYVIKGGSPRSEAYAEAKSRAAGLGAVVAGLILSGIASILSVTVLP